MSLGLGSTGETRQDERQTVDSTLKSHLGAACSGLVGVVQSSIARSPPMPLDPATANEQQPEGGSPPPSKVQGPPSSPPRSSEGSPSSLIMARGRSRIRKISSDADPFSEEILRKRYVSWCGYHMLGSIELHSTHSHFGTFFLSVSTLRPRTGDIIASNRWTRRSTSKGDGSSCVRWVRERMGS